MKTFAKDNLRPLSVAQLGIWVAQRLDPDGPNYNIGEYLEIMGPVDPGRFEMALRRVVAEADALRIRIVEADNGPQQYIDPDIEWVMPFIDVSTEPDPRAVAEAWMHEDMGRVADLTHAPLFGYALFRAAADRFFWYVRYHHLVNDGFGGALIAERLAERYSALAESSTLEETKRLSWLDLLDDEEGYRCSAHYVRDREYWRKQLAECPAPVTLCGKPPARSRGFIRCTDYLGAPDADALRGLCRATQASVPEVLTAAAAIYLHRVTGESDLTLGMPLTARFGARMRSIVGMCTNVLPLRLAIDSTNSFGDLLKQVSRGMRQMLRHQRYRAEDLRHDLALRPDAPEPYGTIINVMAFDYDLRFDGNMAQGHNLTNGPVNDLSIAVYDRQDGFDIRIDFDANPEHYTKEVLAAHQRRFLVLLAQCARAEADLPLHEFEILDAHERHMVLQVFNATQMEFPRDGTIHELFAEQAARTPDAVALTFRDRNWTYRELDQRAEAIAWRLREAGVQAETLVGVCVERSPELVAGMLGILKAGAAYLPLDHTYPPDRLAVMVEDAQPLLVLASGGTRDRLAAAKTTIQLVEEDQSSVANHADQSNARRASGSNLAYALYTSGSTGKPKAVMVEHRNVMNFFAGMDAVLGREPGVWLAVASASFDASVLELWWSLTRGYQVVLWPGVEGGRDSTIPELISTHGVTHVLLVPSFLWTLLTLPGANAAFSSLKTLVVGAEAVSPELIKEIGPAPARRIVNMYGPTETTVVATAWDIAPGAVEIPIGRPIANTQVYILDRHGQPVPVGVVGEMFVGGASVARGYLGRPELTAERFVPDRFKGSEARLYRTGDLARYRSDGAIDFVGRLDHQVKIRGFRIEAGEIEAVLGTHPGVRAAVIDVQDAAGGGKRLVAYVVPRTAGELTAKELREWVGRELPAYMVPAAFVTLDALPRAPTGKLDRKALPPPERGQPAGKMFVAPRNPTEEVMARIWAEVLDVPQVGAHHDFFELGGHSLLAIQVLSRIAHTFKVEIPLRTLFESPTVADLGAAVTRAIDGRVESLASSAKPIARQARISGHRPDGYISGGLDRLMESNAGMDETHLHVPDSQTSSFDANRNDLFVFRASFAQERLWILDRLEPDRAQYNIPAAYRLRGRLDRTALEQGLNEIVRRHEALRTTFASQDGQTVQVIAPASKLELPVIDLEGCPTRDAELERSATREAQQPFTLETGPLLRVKLFRLGEDDHVLSLTIHHIVSDGWSMGVLLRELTMLYEAFAAGKPSPLAELPIQYADYAVWQREWLKGEELDRQLGYWKRQLAGLSVLELPTDRPRPKVQSYRGAWHRLSFSPELTVALKALGRREHATLFMTLAVAFQTLLHRYSGQDDIALGVPVASRNRMELESLIGFFVNTLVLRGDLSANPTFQELLAQVRETALGAYAHQDLPFEKLVAELRSARDMSRNPLFQVMFAVQEISAVEWKLASLTVSPVFVETGTARLDLALFLSETGGALQGALEYSTDLFDASTIERMVGHFQVLLEAIASDPDQNISTVPMLPAVEREQLLSAWNATSVDYPREKTLPQLFEDQAARTPEQVAVRFEQEALTYAELNRRANQLAQYLHTLGVGPGTAVGICLERSLDMVVALLGILKAGGAYVPLDPAFPRDRLAFMVADAGLSLIVTKEDLKDAVPGIDGPAVCLDTAWGQISQQPAEPPGQLATSDDIAYVIYTSGSTGKPKGVEVPHRALTNFLWAMRTAPGCTAQDVLLAVTTLSFDIAALELYLPLIVGGRIELVSREVAADGRRLRERLERCCPTLMQATPATWRMLLDAGWQGTPGLTALCGGEALPRDLATELLERTAALWNMYGPTETTIWSSADRISPDDPEITIGRPIANTEFYILDKHRQPVPVGVPGELFIGGDGLARGYRHRPELTADRFIPHPFATVPGARVYRTGDLARYRADGRVVHLGRLDHQVKVRGFRIELGEIEAALAAHEGVGQAVVTVRDDRPGDRSLVAYLVPAPGRAVVPVELRQHLRRTLPEYMVPQFFVELEAFPLTPNGKVDRRQLPAPERGLPCEAAAVVAPRTPTEERVAQIWAEVLKVPQVGAHHDFFELGGHSLLAIQVLSQIAHTFKVELPLRVLFTAPTVAQLAEEVDSAIGSLRRSPHGALADTSERRGPRTRTEHRLLAIWERLLDAGPIGVRDSFFDLQGDADLFDKMLAETRSAFGAFAEGLPVSTIRKEPTIETLARIIDDSIPPVSSLVVSLQPHGSGRPLFLIHAAGGYVFFYRALAAHLGPHRLVYGVRAETRTDGRGQSFDRSQSVEELAARYIAEIKTRQSDGPYYLGGACFGGVVAFEMARQLRLRGEEVGPVLLFDSFVLNNGNCREEDGLPTWTNPGVAPLRQRITTHLKRASQLNLGRAVWYVSQKVASRLVSEVRLAIRALWRKLPSGVSDLLDDLICFAWRMRGKPDSLERTQLRMMARFLERAAQLLRKYVPSVHEGSLVLFKAGQGHDPTPLWRDLARGGMVVHERFGVHLDMLEEPTVAETAALVRQYLLKDGTSVVSRIGT